MEDSAGAAVEAAAPLKTCRSRLGRKARPSVSIMPTKIAARNAPRIEPMPPITMMTKARMRMFSPMPICTVRIGASNREMIGADQHADTGAHHAKIKQQRHQQRDDDDGEAVR